jgi:hypothetical protein
MGASATWALGTSWRAWYRCCRSPPPQPWVNARHTSFVFESRALRAHLGLPAAQPIHSTSMLLVWLEASISLLHART